MPWPYFLIDQVVDIPRSTVLSSDLVGFGVGTGTDYRFDDVSVSPAGTLEAPVFYQYDALGRRVAKTMNGETTYYTYAGPRLIEERDDQGALAATYVYGNYIDEVLQMRRGGEDYFYHTDDQFNVMAVTDSCGAVVERYDYGDFGYPQFYAPDGSARDATAIGNPWLFTGRQWDPELAAYYYRTRYFDPLAGRFLSPDAIGNWGDPLNLGNAYTYTGNNPWSWVDPWGQGALPFFQGGTPDETINYYLGEFVSGLFGLLGGGRPDPANNSYVGFGGGGMARGYASAATFRIVTPEENPTPISRMGMELGARYVIVLDPAERLYTGTTVTGLPARANASKFLSSARGILGRERRCIVLAVASIFGIGLS